jgi:hypothetical protein
MTDKELKRLKPGDKITYDISALDPGTCSTTIEDLTNYLDEYGYYIFERFTGTSVRTRDLHGNFAIFGIIENIKLYKPRPWSYERDY